MKFWVLKLFIEVLKKKRKIVGIYRVDDNIIKIIFDTETYFFDMRRGESFIYPQPQGFIETKKYSSPFDVQLSKSAMASEILGASLLGGDKIVKLDIQKSGKYKSQKYSLFFEFTGKFTNFVITDEKGTIIDALRHIDSSVSVREIKPSMRYTPPPKADIKYSETPDEEDIIKYLQKEYEKKESLALENLKRQHLAKIAKKREKLEKILYALESAASLEKKSKEMYEKANLLLSNRDKIAPYEKRVLLKDFDGNEKHIELDGTGNVSRTIDEMFKRAKKSAKKAKNINIESESLENKVAFFKKFEDVVKMAKNRHELQILFPKKIKNAKESVTEHYEVFFVKGYRILLGKNERGNIELLKSAKAGDIWMHLKDRPSTHIIIPTNKKEIPMQVLEEAAKLCASFSADLCFSRIFLNSR